jgi:hypothetical protein
VTKNKSKSKNTPKPIREEWTDDVIQDLKNYCNKIALTIYPDVTSPLLAMDDVTARYLGNFVPINPLGDKRSLSLCLLSYPPYSLEVGDDLSHLTATLHRPDTVADQQRILLPVNSLDPTVLVKSISNHINIISSDRDDSRLKRELRLLDTVSEILNGADVVLKSDGEELFEKSRSDLVACRKKELGDGLEKLSIIANPPNSVELQMMDSVEFNQAFNAWAGSLVIKYDGIARQVLKYRFMLMVCAAFLRICSHKKNDNNYLLSCVAKCEADSRINVSGTITKKFLQEMKEQDSHSTEPNKDELNSIQRKSKELLALLAGRADDMSMLLQLYKLSKSKKSDFSGNGLIAGQGSDDSGSDARVFIKSLASFLIYHEFDYLLFCQLAGDRYYRSAVKHLEDQIVSIITPLVDMFFDNTSKGFVKSNSKPVIKQIEKDLKQVAPTMGYAMSLNGSNAGDVMSYQLGNAKSSYGFEPEAVQRFISSLDHKKPIESQCVRIRKRVAEYKGADFWEDLFSYTGKVNDLMAYSDLERIEYPDVNDPLWIDMVDLARSSIPFLKSKLEKDSILSC